MGDPRDNSPQYSTRIVSADRQSQSDTVELSVDRGAVTGADPVHDVNMPHNITLASDELSALGAVYVLGRGHGHAKPDGPLARFLVESGDGKQFLRLAEAYRDAVQRRFVDAASRLRQLRLTSLANRRSLGALADYLAKLGGGDR